MTDVPKYDYANDPTHQAFTSFEAPHILMITNHGVHQWEVSPGLPDTGGQNMFVNMFTDTLADLGFRITIVNRGGYSHPVTGEMQAGLRYKDARRRILYLEDGTPEFVRKEDMDAHTPRLAEFLWQFLESPAGGYVDMIISHYWDGAKVGALVRRNFRHPTKHVWVPHSLGTVKKRNMKPETWKDLRIDERIAIEKELIGELDAVAATSPLIRQALVENYGVAQPLFLPPCIDPKRFHPRQIDDEHKIYGFLGRHCGMSAREVRRCRIITEISRTDTTKRKDILIRAFAEVHKEHPDTLLVVSIDPHEKNIHDELWNLIGELGIASHVAVMGNIWEWLPDLYAITDVYCSPSVMEGFGMAVQEAAATCVPVIGSNLIPFVTEYLLGDPVEEITCKEAKAPLKLGKGGMVVEADDVGGFACALKMLLADEELGERMGQTGYAATIPYFTWDGMTRQFLETAGFGEVARTRFAAVQRPHLDEDTLQKILQAEHVEDLSVMKLEALFRGESELAKFLPEETRQVDPRDGSVVIYNAARARRPHDNAELPAQPEEDGANDPICRGETTGVIDVASLSEGFTFINKNLYPVLYPFENASESTSSDGQDGNPGPRGMHFLHWTSSYFDRDWYNMPQSDRLTAMSRLATLEKKLLLDKSSSYPASGTTCGGQTTHGFLLLIKNHGRAVGGSLAHGHQQVLYSNLKPAHIARNERFEKKHGETFAAYMLRENPAELMLTDYGSAVLMVPYFMRRPYNMLLVLKDHRKRHLFECTKEELSAVAQAWGDATGAIMALMPSIGKAAAYNITVSNGPGAGLYCEFLPYTQETGGFEHLGLWVCQDTPQRVADNLRQVLARAAESGLVA
ncbi:MAG: glycosyltransferase [Pirellulales bacterium]|nr:glycosyltransferase [Pirellulales bacterium]